MNDDISRRDLVVLMSGAGMASIATPPVEGAAAARECAPAADRCPYFDQPLFCKGKKYCQ